MEERLRQTSQLGLLHQPEQTEIRGMVSRVTEEGGDEQAGNEE